MQNTGTRTWTKGDFVITKEGSSQILYSSEEVRNDVLPNQTVKFDSTARSPSASGTYTIQWIMADVSVSPAVRFGETIPTLSTIVVTANTTPPPTPADPADLSVWRPSTGHWWVINSSGGEQFVGAAWGMSGDDPRPGDYDGDGLTDFCVFRASTNTWWILRSSDGGYSGSVFGSTGDIPAPADYDGDGKTDIAVFRPSTGVWYITYSSNGTIGTPQLGTGGGFTPAPADYDGDGRADVSVWYNAGTTFYTIYTNNNPQQQYTALQFEKTGLPVSADYDGDDKADYAVKEGNAWYIKQSSTDYTLTYHWEEATDIPVQNDYDGDGMVDIAVWRESTGDWYIRQSSNLLPRIVHWGQAGDFPVPANYRK